MNEEELLSFNSWLKSPWPHKEGKRPHTMPRSLRMLIGQLGEDKIFASRNWPNDRETKDSYSAPYRIIMPDRKLDA
jgi:hypothetical protein